MRPPVLRYKNSSSGHNAVAFKNTRKNVNVVEGGNSGSLGVVSALTMKREWSGSKGEPRSEIHQVL